MIAAAAYAARGDDSVIHGLTPTAKCGRRIRGFLEPRAGAPGDYHLKICPPAVSWFRGERRSRGWPKSAEVTSPTGLP